jgi:ABC-2 type transport system ATP-binding protein
MLEVQHISKSYENQKALDDISFSIPKGSIYGLLGPNGAGKTTLIRIINRIIFQDTGNITFDGEELKDKHLQRIGYLPEERGLYKKMKVKEQLAYFASLRNYTNAKMEIDEWLEKFSLTEWANKKVEELSKGMQQKVQFINAVLHKPEFIILDEPFSGFDPVNVALVIEEIRRLNANGSTILYSTHRMESVEELCDDILMINKAKKVVDGKIFDVKQSFKDYSWTVGIDSELDDNGLEGCEIAFTKKQQGVNYYRITNSSENALWKAELANKYNLIHLSENLPSINDIFIKHAN